MANPFDQFDETPPPQGKRSNPFDQFDEPMNTATKPAAVRQPTSAPRNGVLFGIRDPIDGAAQLLMNSLPESVVKTTYRLNNWLADKTGMVDKIPEGGIDEMVRNVEAEYQAARKAAGKEGIDWGRMAGNLASLVLPGTGIQKAVTALPKVGKMGAALMTGAATNALSPVYEDENFWAEKGMQAGFGAALGVGGKLAGNAVARVISPKASVNPDVQALRKAGVRMSIGQTLGGMANDFEQTAQSLPVTGGVIRKVREQARKDFQRETINHAVLPIGGRIDKIGQEGVRDAGDMLSQSYQDALKHIHEVRFGQKFQALIKSKYLTEELSPDMERHFAKVLNDKVFHRLSPAQSMTARAFKKAESDLGLKASTYSKSGMASEQELGDALRKLQYLIRKQVVRQNPQHAKALRAADQGWAKQVRIEKAAGKNAGSGEFTPKQLLQAIRETDSSVRRRAVARGESPMQDWASKGDRVLSETVPNSGTADRTLPVAIGYALANNKLLVGSAMAGGWAAYLPVIQRLLTSSVAVRPQAAQGVANKVNQATPFFTVPSVVAGNTLLDR